MGPSRLVSVAPSPVCRMRQTHRMRDPWGRYIAGGCSQQNTPQAGASSRYVRITHPHHPLAGRRVRVVRQTGPATERQWVIELDDQTHACIPLAWAVPADAPASPPWRREPSADALWADVTTLLRLATMVRTLTESQPAEVASDEPSTCAERPAPGIDSPQRSQRCTSPLGAVPATTPAPTHHSTGGDPGQALAGEGTPGGGH